MGDILSGERRAAIRGCGLVTPLGSSLAQTWDALLAGGCIRDHSRAQLTGSDHPNRVTALALQAAGEAVADAGWTAGCLADPATALVVGTSKGPVESWLLAQGLVQSTGFSLLNDKTGEEQAKACTLNAGLAQIAATLSPQLALGPGPRLTYSGACASGLQALVRAVLLIWSGEAQRVLVVAAESSLHPLFLGSFTRLGVLASAETGCRPFDEHREGFLVSEAAAAVCLERATSDAAAGILVDRCAMAGDATHITAADPTGRTLRRLLGRVVDGRPVDLFHAHGTGTLLNDPVELAAIEDATGGLGDKPSLYSHKGAIGHSLGASGLISIVLNCLSQRRGIIPPNVRTGSPLAARRVSISRPAVQRPIRRSVAVAAGFGGAMAAVSLYSREAGAALTI